MRVFGAILFWAILHQTQCDRDESKKNEVMAIQRCEINNGNDANSQENEIKELNKMKIVILMWKYIWFLINLRLFYATRARWCDFRSTIYCNISQLMRVHGFHEKIKHAHTHTSNITGTILVMSIFSRWIQCFLFLFFFILLFSVNFISCSVFFSVILVF